MVHAPPPARSTPAGRDRPPISRRLWRTPLVVGLCFGLGYGITSRLLALRWSGFVQLGQSFDVRPFPGTTLQSLRERFGAESLPIRADLDQIEQQARNRQSEEQARRAAEEAEKRLQQPEASLDSAGVVEPELRPEPLPPAQPVQPSPQPPSPSPAPPRLPPPAAPSF